MAEEQLDELFGGIGAPRPRAGLAIALAASGALLSIAGLGCTTIPGLLVSLGAWNVVETELDRVESGYLALEHEGRLKVIRAVVLAIVLSSVALLVVQGVLLVFGVYDVLWSLGLAVVLEPWLSSGPPAPTP